MPARRLIPASSAMSSPKPVRSVPGVPLKG